MRATGGALIGRTLRTLTRASYAHSAGLSALIAPPSFSVARTRVVGRDCSVPLACAWFAGRALALMRLWRIKAEHSTTGTALSPPDHH